MVLYIKPSEKAFTLVELMVVIAIIGLTLTIAVPIYTSVVNKVNLSQMVNKMSSFKLPLIDAYSSTNSWPATINGATAPATVADTFFANAVNFRYKTDGNKAWWGYQLSSNYGSGWIFMLLIANADGTFDMHCGALSTSCTFGSCSSSAYFPTECAELNLSTTYTLSDS